MSISMIIWTLVLFFIFRFLTKYIMPIVRMSKAASARFKDMQEQMSNMGQQQGPRPEVKRTSAPKPNKSDYIDYEEIK